MTETWKAVPGYEGAYEVSDLGRVRSLDRYVSTLGRAAEPYRRLIKGRVLKTQQHSGGYDLVSIQEQGRRRATVVHILVAEAFLGPCPAREEVCHNDGDPANSRAGNLRYDTRRGNFADKLLHGTQFMGETHPLARLTGGDVQQIRAAIGTRREDLAQEFGVSRSQIRRVQDRTNWRHV